MKENLLMVFNEIKVCIADSLELSPELSPPGLYVLQLVEEDGVGVGNGMKSEVGR